MNIQQLMKQAQAMQKKMADAQGELASLEIEGSAGGDMVKLTISGEGAVKNLSINKSALDADNLEDDIEVLEDLIVTAFNNARKKLDDETANTMGGIGGDMGLPAGFKMPF